VVSELSFALIHLLWIKKCEEMVLNPEFIRTWRGHEKKHVWQSKGNPMCHGGLQILSENLDLFLWKLEMRP
jgi:hypothetical protein